MRPLTNYYHKWAIVWRSENKLDGVTRHFMGEANVGMTQLYRTRKEARTERDLRWGYFRDREDLKREPHGWKMPQVVKVFIMIAEE